MCDYFVVLYQKPPKFKATIHSLQEEKKAKIRNLLEENSKHPSSDGLKLHQNPTVPCICSARLDQAWRHWVSSQSSSSQARTLPSPALPGGRVAGKEPPEELPAQTHLARLQAAQSCPPGRRKGMSGSRHLLPASFLQLSD